MSCPDFVVVFKDDAIKDKSDGKYKEGMDTNGEARLHLTVCSSAHVHIRLLLLIRRLLLLHCLLILYLYSFASSSSPLPKAGIVSPT